MKSRHTTVPACATHIEMATAHKYMPSIRILNSHVEIEIRTSKWRLSTSK